MPNLYPPHSTFTSQHSLNYITLSYSVIPSKATIAQLTKLADKIPPEDFADLLPYIRQIAIQRCTATLCRARSEPRTSKEQLKSYERYLGLARTGKSLLEQTLVASFTRRLTQIPTNKGTPS